MPPVARVLIGLALALLAGWLSHAALGRGEAFIARVEAHGRLVVRAAELDRVEVRMARDPMRREAILSGPADAFQREGSGRFPGLNDRILNVPGVAAVRWTDEQQAGRGVLPLLVETELLAAFFFLIGLGIGWLRYRPRREGFL